MFDFEIEINYLSVYLFSGRMALATLCPESSSRETCPKPNLHRSSTCVRSAVATSCRQENTSSCLPHSTPTRRRNSWCESSRRSHTHPSEYCKSFRINLRKFMNFSAKIISHVHPEEFFTNVLGKLRKLGKLINFSDLVSRMKMGTFGN